jgi:hypothetical protein
MTIVGQQVKSNAVILQLVQELYDAFEKFYNVEASIVDGLKGNALTQDLAEQDRRRDRCLVGMNSAISAGLHHFDQSVEKAAALLKLRFKSFNGEMEKKSYEEEAAAIRILLNDLQTTYAAEVSKLGIGEWVTELLSAQDAFDAIYIERNRQLSLRPDVSMKTVRGEVDRHYRLMIGRIEAYNVVEDGIHDAFVDVFNQNIDYFNEHVHYHVKFDLGKGNHTDIKPIDVQMFTGKPITPIPTVYYRNDGGMNEELSLGTDYSVSYKGNVEPGMAEIIVRGKGKYKGSKSSTFSIVAPEE